MMSMPTFESPVSDVDDDFVVVQTRAWARRLDGRSAELPGTTVRSRCSGVPQLRRSQFDGRPATRRGLDIDRGSRWRLVRRIFASRRSLGIIAFAGSW